MVCRVVILQAENLVVPQEVVDLGSFHGWVRSHTFPDRGRIDFLLENPHAQVSLQRIVRVDHRADAVLERRNDLPARGVVLRIGGEDHQHVKRKTNVKAANLDVLLLHDVE